MTTMTNITGAAQENPSDSYLAKIEAAYSNGRGKSSRLSPMDWNLADTWEKRRIPLRIVLKAIEEGFKDHAANRRAGSINSLRYFVPSVEKEFASWSAGRAGKSSDDDGNELRDFRKPIIAETAQNNMSKFTNENIQIIEQIISSLPDNAPEPLLSAIKILCGELLHLRDDIAQKNLALTPIEDRLAELAESFEIQLILIVPEDEREQMLEDVKKNYDPAKLTDQLQQKIVTKQLYKRFDLPELTLLAI